METIARFTAELCKFISITRCNYNLPDVQWNFDFLCKMIKVYKVDFKLKEVNEKDAKNDGYLPN